MESSLSYLNNALELTLQSLKLHGAELADTIHNNDKLPDRKISSLAAKSVDMLFELEKALTPDPLLLSDFFFGYMNTKCLCAAVELNIPDALRKGPKTVPELAEICGAREDRFRQILRQLQNQGVFTYDRSTDSYSNNSVSELLLTDHWTQWRNWVDLYGNEFYEMSAGIPASIRKDADRVPAQIAFDTDKSMFQYFSDAGLVPKLHKTLGGGAIAQAPGILQDYPWGEIEDMQVLDIGGGGGGLIALLLRAHPRMRGGILDLERVIEEAKFNFHSSNGQYHDVGSQVPDGALVPGNFLEAVPPSEVYTMKWCLHDWNDSKALQALKVIRAGISEGPRSRLIILESLLGDGRSSRLSRYGDLNMMVAVGGMERDEPHWRSLAQQTGWRVSRIVSLRNAWPSAIELVPVSSMDGIGEEGMIPATEASPLQENRPKAFNDVLDHSDNIPQVKSTMRFLAGPWDASKGNPFIRTKADPGYEHMNFTWSDHEVVIRNARPHKDDFETDIHGFAYYDHEISPETIEAIRAGDRQSVETHYYPQIQQFVKDITGAEEVIVFDHTVRKRRLELGETENDTGKEQPATMVHCDQSTKGALKRVEQNLPSGFTLESALARRVRILNVWRPLNGPVEDWPLAQMDYRSCPADAIQNCDLLQGAMEERGQTLTLTHSDKQQWYYLDGQDTNEVAVLKIWDNKDDVDAKLCPHAAFKLPNAKPDAKPRESVEIRCVVIDKM